EMIGEIRNDAAVDVVGGEFAAEIGECVIEGFFDHQPEILVGMSFGEPGDSTRDHVDRSHKDGSRGSRAEIYLISGAVSVLTIKVRVAADVRRRRFAVDGTVHPLSSASSRRRLRR